MSKKLPHIDEPNYIKPAKPIVPSEISPKSDDKLKTIPGSGTAKHVQKLRAKLKYLQLPDDCGNLAQFFQDEYAKVRSFQEDKESDQNSSLFKRQQYGSSVKHFAEASYGLGYCYSNGLSVGKNNKTAVYWYNLAAAQDYAEAQFGLGKCYAKGTGVVKDAKEAVRLFRLAADQGNTEAQYSLGECYVMGTGVAKDDKEAVRLFRLAADQGDIDAQFNLGVCYAKGTGVDKDSKEAVRLFRLAADQGDIDAQEAVRWYKLLAADQGDAEAQDELVCYKNETVVVQDDKEIVRLFRLAADQGDAKAQFGLGKCYANGTGVAKDAKEAVRWYKLAADQGHAVAQVNLGVCYENGTGVVQDDKEAVYCYKLAAKQRNAQAQFELGKCYANGTGVAKDYKEAVRLFRLAAEQGYAQAQFHLGACYTNGTGVAKDYKEAVRLFRLAAEQGYAQAQFNLGMCYVNGAGVAKDYKEAVRLFRLAAEQGFAQAQFNLGACYANGMGVVKDYKEAVPWFRLAADQGRVKAQLSLAACYANGAGVAKDAKEAVRWFRLAADQGDAAAQGKLGSSNASKKEHTIRMELSAAILSKDDLSNIVPLLGDLSSLETPIDSRGNTPLMLAVETRNSPLTMMLLSMGAKPTSTNNKGSNAFDLASRNEDTDVAGYLASFIKFDKELTPVLTAYSDCTKKLSNPIISKAFYGFFEPLQYLDKEKLSIYEKYDLAIILYYLVEICEKAQSTQEFFYKIKLLLGRRERLIKSTSLDYCFSPSSVANSLLKNIASFVIKEEKSEEEDLEPNDLLLRNRKKQRATPWFNVETKDENLPQYISEIFCWTDKDDSSEYEEIHHLKVILDTAIEQISKREFNIERTWRKTDSKSERTAPLPRKALFVLRQIGPGWRQLIDFSLSVDKIHRNPDSLYGRLAALREGLFKGSNNEGQTGTEYKAGTSAQDAVGIFSEWFNDLSSEIKKKIRNLRAYVRTGYANFNGDTTLGDIFDLLVGSKELKEFISANYCVDILGKQIECIYTANANIEKIEQIQKLIDNNHKKKQQKEIKDRTYISSNDLETLQKKALSEISSSSRKVPLIDNSDSYLGTFVFKIISEELHKSSSFPYHSAQHSVLDRQEPPVKAIIKLFEKNCFSMSALEVADEDKNLDFIEKSASEDLFDCIRNAKGNRRAVNFENFKQILKIYPKKINAVEKGSSLLAFAVNDNLDEFVELLLRDENLVLENLSYCDEIINIEQFAKSESVKKLLRKSLLKNALKKSNKEEIVRLVTAEPSLSEENLLDGEPPLTFLLNCPDDKEQIVFFDLLIEKGADVLAKNAKGKNALDIIYSKTYLEKILSDDTDDKLIDNNSYLIKKRLETILQEAIIRKNIPLAQEILRLFPEFILGLTFHTKIFSSSSVYTKTHPPIIKLLKEVIFSKLKILIEENRYSEVAMLIADNPILLHENYENQNIFSFLLDKIPSVCIKILSNLNGNLIFNDKSLLEIINQKNLIDDFSDLFMTLFRQAIISGNLQEVKEILNYYPSLEDKYFEEPPLLVPSAMLAANHGHEKIVEFFLNKNLNHLFKESNTRTILAKDFLMKKFTSNPALNEVIAQAVFKYSLFDESEHFIKMLLKYDKPFEEMGFLNAPFIAGETPLTFMLQNLEKVTDSNKEILLSCKPDLFQENKYGKTPFEIAKEKKSLPLLKNLAKESLVSAIKEGNLPKFKQIIDYFPEFIIDRYRDEKFAEVSLFSLTVDKNNTEMMDLLIDQPRLTWSLPDLKNYHGVPKEIYQKLQVKVFKKIIEEKNQEDLAEFFKENKLLLNDCFCEGETPLTYAIKQENHWLISRLSEYKSESKSELEYFKKNSYGESPIHLMNLLKLLDEARKFRKKFDKLTYAQKTLSLRHSIELIHDIEKQNLIHDIEKKEGEHSSKIENKISELEKILKLYRTLNKHHFGLFNRPPAANTLPLSQAIVLYKKQVDELPQKQGPSAHSL